MTLLQNSDAVFELSWMGGRVLDKFVAYVADLLLVVDEVRPELLHYFLIHFLNLSMIDLTD